MSLTNRAVRRTMGFVALVALAFTGLLAAPASAQRNHGWYAHHHRKHRVVVTRRVPRHGHWVTVRHVIYR